MRLMVHLPFLAFLGISTCTPAISAQENDALLWEERFQVMDADEDKTITKEEFNVYHTQAFSVIDVDGNDALTKDECLHGCFDWGVLGIFSSGRDVARSTYDNFESIDTDSDSTVTLDELLAYALDKFAQLDKNTNGVLTKDEFQEESS